MSSYIAYTQERLIDRMEFFWYDEEDVMNSEHLKWKNSLSTYSSSAADDDKKNINGWSEKGYAY